jgi:GTP-binding protein
MKIKSAEFVMSNSDVTKCPKEKLIEYAFIGRSNVGKSSLINMLMQKKSLAKTSGRPGKTQLINHGYGYAKVSKSSKRIFQKFITQYFSKRQQLALAFVLIDCRHKPQKVDLEFMQWMGENQVPFSIIFTKQDKMKPNALIKNIEDYKLKMLESWEEMPNYFITSSSNGTGRDKVLNYMSEINSLISKQD